MIHVLEFSGQNSSRILTIGNLRGFRIAVHIHQYLSGNEDAAKTKRNAHPMHFVAWAQHFYMHDRGNAIYQASMLAGRSLCIFHILITERATPNVNTSRISRQVCM